MAGESNRTNGGVERLIHWLSIGLRTVSMVLMFVMMLFVATDIIGRLVFNMPLKGSTDLIELMMGIIVFCGMAYCAKEDGHVRVDVVYDRLPERGKACLDIVTFAASLLVYVLISWRLFSVALRYMVEPSMGRSTDILKIPHAGFIAIAAFGSAVMCLELVVYLIHAFSRLKQQPVV